MRMLEWVALSLLVGLVSCDGDPAGPGEEEALLLAPSNDVRLAKLESGSTFRETLEYPDSVRVGEPFEVQFEVWLDGALRLDREDALTVGREVVFLTYGRFVGEGPTGPINWGVGHELVVDEPGRYQLIFIGSDTTVYRRVVAVE